MLSQEKCHILMSAVMLSVDVLSWKILHHQLTILLHTKVACYFLLQYVAQYPDT